MPVHNRFFQSALRQAAHVLGKPGRIARILASLAVKITRVDWSPAGRIKLKEQLLLIGRLLKASLTGRYSLTSKRTLVALLAVCIYFLNPFDLIPDVLAGVGLVDDMALITWAVGAAAAELEAFEKWERATSVSP